MRVLSNCTLLACLLYCTAHAGAVSDRACGEADGNPLASLGCALFHARELSADGTVACATCHEPSKAFADGKPVAVGVARRSGTRNTPTLLAASLRPSLFWDGRRDSLEALVFDPIRNPLEMGLGSDQEAIDRVRKRSDLVHMFTEAFAGSSEPTADQMRVAIAAYIRTLPPHSSAYDRFHSDEARYPLPPAAARGMSLFRGKAGCSTCHTVDGDVPEFTDDSYHHSSVGWQTIAADLPALTQEVIGENVPVAEVGRRVTADARWAALGRFVVTRKAEDIAAFRTPSLRNVAVTAPYMHDGSVPTLEDAVSVEIYYRGLSSRRPLDITLEEQASIVAFLRTLTDAAYRSNAGASAPGRRRP